MSSMSAPPHARRVQYPESDGKPMGETDLHLRTIIDLLFALRWFLTDTRAYVAGNLFIYYEEGNPRASVAPDVFVVLGVEQRDRRTFRVWDEGGRLPNVVIEVTSKKTRKADKEQKPLLYARLGIPEYFLFDPHGEWLKPQLQGFRLVNGAYQPIVEQPLRSAVLDLELRVDDNALRFYNPRTGERLPTSDEEALARRAAEVRADAEAARADAEAVRADAEAVRADAEAARADAAESELARLRAERGDA